MLSNHSTYWRQAPLVRLIVPLILGVVLAWNYPMRLTFSPVILFCILLFIATLLLILIEWKVVRYRKYVNAALYLFIFVIGAILTNQHDKSLQNNFSGKYLQKDQTVELRLREPLVEKPASWKAEADIIGVEKGQNFHSTTGRAILYFQKTDSLLPLHYGDVILVSNQLQPIKNSGNPGAFDYKRYCHLQNIYYQAYLPSGTWKKLSFTRTDPLQSFFLFCRSWCLKTLSKYITKNKELGVAEALLVGYRDNLNKALVQAYARAGVVHIIAISGLHLGLIYLILLWIFSPIPDKRHGRWLKGLLIILSLWCFSMITGAAPSALRAAVMFSFLAAGKFFFRRKANTINTLAASAFLLLCYNPFLLFDVGFQLSYLAVLGILVFQKPIFHLFIFKNKIWNYLWEMTSLSIAAELLTFPLALYYFHRFPALFLISNLIVIPLSSFILYGEIFLLVIAAITPVATFIGMVVTHAISIMDWIIMEVDSFSFSSLQTGVLMPVEVVFIYLFLMMVAIWLMYKNKKALIMSLSILLLFSIMVVFNMVHTFNQREIIVYNIPHYTAIDFIKGRNAYFVGDTDVNQSVSLLKYDVSPARMALHTSLTNQLVNDTVRKNFIRFYNIGMVILDSAFSSRLKKPLYFPVDYVLVSHNPKLDVSLVKHIFSPKMIIFDSSDPWWKIEKWKTACKQLNLPCFSVPDQGAWKLSLK